MQFTKFTKMEGAGNDYVYIDARDQKQDWPELSRRMSDRHFGVGSDGLILIADSDVADLRMVMFNADGSQGEMCGNGIRCFAKYAIDRGIAAPSSDGLKVETLAGIRTVVPTFDGSRITGARVAMGAPILTTADVPVLLAEELPPPVLAYPFSMDGLDLPLSFQRADQRGPTLGQGLPFQPREKPPQPVAHISPHEDALASSERRRTPHTAH